MDTAIGTFQVQQKGAITPKRGEVRPIHISLPGRREIDEQTVTDLVKALIRDGRFLHPIVVREEGATAYRLIAGHHRLEAWKRHSCKLRPIPADIYPADTPDALITILEIEENLLRKELTTEERKAQTIRLAAALKKLDAEKLATELPLSGSDAKSATRGGRGKKAATARVAVELRLSKPAVQKRIKMASAAIGEKIDLDRDTPEELERKAAELERKADKRQHADPKVVRLKRRKPAPRAVTEDATVAESQAGEIDSEIKEVWRAFSALSERKQLAIMLRACRLRGWALRMGRARRVPAGDEEPAVTLPLKAAQATYDTAVDSQPEQQEGGADVSADDLQHPGSAVSQAADQEPELAVDLPTEVAPATDAVAEQVEHGDEVALAGAEQGDDGADLGAEDLQVGDDDAFGDADDGAAEDADDNVTEAVDPEDSGAEDLHAAGDGGSKPADQEPGGAMKCAYCGEGFSSTDPSVIKDGRLLHRNKCIEWAKPIAIAA